MSTCSRLRNTVWHDNNKFSDSLILSKILKIAAKISIRNTDRSLIVCENVAVENIGLYNSTSWQVVPTLDNVLISNINIVSDQVSDDSIDIVRSIKVGIETELSKIPFPAMEPRLDSN